MDRRYFVATDRANEVARLLNVIAMNRAYLKSTDYIEIGFVTDLEKKLSDMEQALQGIIRDQMKQCGTQHS